MGGLLKFSLFTIGMIMASYEGFVHENVLLRNLYGEAEESDGEAQDLLM